MSTEHSPDEVPDWLLERYRLGELPPAEAQRLDDALARAPQVRRRLDELERSSAELLRRHPPAVVAAALAARLRSPGRGRTRTVAPLATAALVAASLAALVVWTPRPRTSTDEDVTRVKGIAPHLLLYRKAASDVERLPPAAVARPHDVVQLAYQAGARRYGVIVSVDGRGVVTRHLPTAGTRAAALAPGTPRPLAQSYELDDAPGYERFVLVAADEPFAVEQVEQALRDQHQKWGAEASVRRLELPESMDQFSFVLRKESSR